MAQHYSDPSRADDPHALPNVETFYADVREFVEAGYDTWQYLRVLDLEPSPHSNLTDCGPLQGWYYWHCFPGCLPDTDPVGPFATEAEALADAQGDA